MLNGFYATDLDVYHMAANYYTSVPSNVMYTSASSVPVNFCYSSQAQISKCTTHARNVQDFVGRDKQNQMLGLEQHFVAPSAKCVKVDVLI